MVINTNRGVDEKYTAIQSPLAIDVREVVVEVEARCRSGPAEVSDMSIP